MLGNCGVGFAPCRPEDRDLLCRTMERAEDIPGVVMAEGLDWSWETFPEYLDALEARPRDIDVAALVPHSAVRVYAMGERGANREPATDADLAAMRAVIIEAIRAGGIGFSTTRTPVDRRSDGALVPSFEASDRELVSAAVAMRDGGGIFQLLPELGTYGKTTPQQEFATMRAVGESSGLSITYTTIQGRNYPDHWLDLLDETRRYNAEGHAPIHPQYFPRPIGMLASFDLTSNPFVHCPGYKALANLPLAARVEQRRRPEIRARIAAETPDAALLPLTAGAAVPRHVQARSDAELRAVARQQRRRDRRAREGRTPEEVAYDMLLEDDGRAMLLVAIGNYPLGTLDHVLTLFEDPNAIMGLGDGGAHYGLVCDSSYPTFVLTHRGRDRPGRRLPLEGAAMTSQPAQVLGLRDCGLLAPGYKADLNVIDLAGPTLHGPRIMDDLPAGGRRLDQGATGYRCTIVGGEVIVRDDRPTGALPGRLLRGAQKAPRVTEAASAA